MGECAFNIAFEDLSEIAWLQLFKPLHLHLVKVLRIILAQVTHQVLVDDLVPDRCCPELAQLELDSVLIQNALRCLLHADRSDVEDVWRAHIVNNVVRRQALQLLGLQLLSVGVRRLTHTCRLLAGKLMIHDGLGRHNLLHTHGSGLLLVHSRHGRSELPHL